MGSPSWLGSRTNARTVRGPCVQPVRLWAGESFKTLPAHARTFLHKWLRDAERVELIRQNLLHLAEGPRRTTSRPEIWTEAQNASLPERSTFQQSVLPTVSVPGRDGVPAWRGTGAAMDAVNLAEAEVTIRASLVRPQGGGHILKRPKTRGSERVVGIPRELVECLGSMSRSSGFVFCRRDGGPLHAGNLRARPPKTLGQEGTRNTTDRLRRWQECLGGGRCTTSATSTPRTCWCVGRTSGRCLRGWDMRTLPSR
jgi:hypothetical protein